MDDERMRAYQFCNYMVIEFFESSVVLFRFTRLRVHRISF